MNRFEKHVHDYHADVHNGRTSDKVLSLCEAEFGRDELRQHGENVCPKWSAFAPVRNYFARAIGIVRLWNGPALRHNGPTPSQASMNRRRRWALTEHDPQLLMKGSMRGQTWHCMSNKVVMNTGFAMRLLQPCSQPGSSGKQRTTGCRMVDAFLTEGEGGAPFVPSRFDTVLAMQKKALDLFSVYGRPYLYLMHVVL